MSTISIQIGDGDVMQVPKQFGKYRFVKMIGSGSFSTVILVAHIYTNEFFACKVVSRNLLIKEKLFMRFEQEVRILQAIHHPGVVSIQEVVFDETFIFVIMEYCQNGELFRYIVTHGPLPENEAKPIFGSIVKSLLYIHQHNISHRDLKPENILLDENYQPKIADFGLCHATSPKSLLSTPCGSPFYAPPEIIRNEKYDGKLADIWSLGIVLFSMVTGTLPWTETNQTQLFLQIEAAEIEIPDHLSYRLRDLLRKMLSKKPSDRPTCDQILEHFWLRELESETSLLATSIIQSGRKAQSLVLKSSAAPIGVRNTQSSKYSPFEKRRVAIVRQPLQTSVGPSFNHLIRKVPPCGKRHH